MQKLTAMFALLFAWSLPFLGCDSGVKEIELRYKLEPGLELTYEQITKKASRIYLADSLVKNFSGTSKMTVRQTVTRRLDSAVAEIREVASWKTKKPRQEDSTKFETVVEKRLLTMRVQPNGRVLDVAFEKGDSLLVHYFKNYYEQGMPVFPAGPVTVGDRWMQNTKVILSPKKTMEASMTYVLTSLVREGGYDCAVIEYDGEVVIPVDVSSSTSSVRSGYDRIKTAGKVYFAYRKGVVVFQQERWSIERKRTRSAEGKKQSYREKIELDVSYRLKKYTFPVSGEEEA